MAKGANYERVICKTLSKWWTGGESDAVFWRTSQSGGRATTRGQKGQKTFGQHGDICATDPIGLPFLKAFAVEIKVGYNRELCLIDCLDGLKGSAKPLIYKWADQADASMSASGAKCWMVIFKRDRRDAVVMMSVRWPMFGTVPHVYRAELTMPGFSVTFMRLSEFVKYFSPETITQIVSKL